MRFHRLMRSAKQSSGLITIASAVAVGVDRRTLARLAQRGLLVRCSRGLYRPAGRALSARDRITAAAVATRGVVSYGSAALLWGFEGGDHDTAAPARLESAGSVPSSG